MYKCRGRAIKVTSPLSELEIKKVRLYYSCRRANDQRRNKVKNYSKHE